MPQQASYCKALALRLVSNRVWPRAILHATHNLFIQGFFAPLTGARGRITSYVIDEFGVAVPVIIVLFALFFWFRRNSLEPNSSTAFAPTDGGRL